MSKKYHTYNKDKFLKESPELYYWMGFLYADGCIVTNTNTHYKIRLQLSEIEPILDFCNYFEIGKLNPRIKAINKERNHITKELSVCGTNKIISIYKLLLGNVKPRLERKWIKPEMLIST